MLHSNHKITPCTLTVNCFEAPEAAAEQISRSKSCCRTADIVGYTGNSSGRFNKRGDAWGYYRSAGTEAEGKMERERILNTEGRHQKGKVPARNLLSDEISRDLKRRGFKYMGLDYRIFSFTGMRNYQRSQEKLFSLP